MPIINDIAKVMTLNNLIWNKCLLFRTVGVHQHFMHVFNMMKPQDGPRGGSTPIHPTHPVA